LSPSTRARAPLGLATYSNLEALAASGNVKFDLILHYYVWNT